MSRIKEANSFWLNSLPDDMKRRSHWIGHSGGKTLSNWIKMGQRCRAFYDEMSQVKPLVGPSTRMLEYGCGGGAILLAFADLFEEVIGVDISSASIRECARQLDSEKFRGICIDIENPEEILNEGPIDLFVSLAVFQHLPSLDYAERILQIASKILRPGGRFFIQGRWRFSKRGNRAIYKECWTRSVVFSPAAFSILAQKVGLELIASKRPNKTPAFYSLFERTT